MSNNEKGNNRKKENKDTSPQDRRRLRIKEIMDYAIKICKLIVLIISSVVIPIAGWNNLSEVSAKPLTQISSPPEQSPATSQSGKESPTNNASSPTPAVTPAPAPNLTPMPAPISLSADELILVDDVEETQEYRYFINSWDSPMYQNYFAINKQFYFDGIGMYVRSKDREVGDIEKAEISFKLPEGYEGYEEYDKLAFYLGADTAWKEDHTSGNGTFRLRIIIDGTKVFDTGPHDFDYHKWIDTEIGLSLDANTIITIELEETVGKKGTLNIVLGDFNLYQSIKK